MFKHLELTFEKGAVLTREMLGELQAFPKDGLDILYDAYPDGIVAGTCLKERDRGEGKKEIFIGKGLVKYGGRIYRMTEDINLTELVGMWMEEGIVEMQTAYRLMFVPADPQFLDGRSTQVLRSLKMQAFPQSQRTEGISFARFKLSGNGDIRLYDPIDLKDLSKAVLWNMTECPYGCRDGVTFHPYIFGIMQRMAAGKKQKRPLDYVVLNQIAMTGVLSFGFMKMISGGQGTPSCTGEAQPDIKEKEAVLKSFIQALMEEAEPAKDSGRKAVKRSGEGRLL